MNFIFLLFIEVKLHLVACKVNEHEGVHVNFASDPM